MAVQSVIALPVLGESSLLPYPIHLKVNTDNYITPFTLVDMGLEEPDNEESQLPVFSMEDLLKAGLFTTIRINGKTTTGRRKTITLYCLKILVEDLAEEIEQIIGSTWNGILVSSVSTTPPGKQQPKN